MHKVLMGAALLLAVFMPMKASAEASIESLLVRRMSDTVNVRVTLKNPTATRQRGPITVDLYARAAEGQDWQRIRTWTDIRFLQPGYRVSRDFFGENNAFLQQLVSSGHFEVKTTVRAPGMADAEEVTSWHDTETGR